MSTKTRSQPAPIQFRPSEPLAEWIVQRSLEWQVTPNEAAKRLAAIAASCTDLEYFYGKLVNLAEAGKNPRGARPDFVRSCEQLKLAIDFTNRTREELGKPSLSQDERLQLIERTAEGMISGKRSQREKAQQQKSRAR